MTTPAKPEITTAPNRPEGFRERMGVFNVNRSRLSSDELQRHADRWVAFRWDGSAVLASDPDIDALVQKLIKAGIDPHRDAMYEWVSDERFASVGGAEGADPFAANEAAPA